MRRIHAEDWILPATAVLGAAADQVTKSLVVSTMELGQTVELASWLTPIFKLTYITNTGVAFGMLPGLGDVFTVVAIVVIVALFLYHRYLPPGQWLVRLALGFQLGGAMGNLVDRLTRGSVVDFIDLNFWPMRAWPVGNLADICIVTGVVLLGATMLLVPEQQDNACCPEDQDDPLPEKGTL